MTSSLHGKNYYRTVVRNLRLIVKCGICGHKQKLEFHHIKPTKFNGASRGSNRRWIDIVKHPDCYIPLCYFCHQKVTRFELKIIWNPIVGQLTWIHTARLELDDWTEADLVRIKVI